jgi:hypothetical protein
MGRGYQVMHEDSVRVIIASTSKETTGTLLRKECMSNGFNAPKN